MCNWIGCQSRNCLTVDVPLGLGFRISVLEPLLSVQICEAAKSRAQQGLWGIESRQGERLAHASRARVQTGGRTPERQVWDGCRGHRGQYQTRGGRDSEWDVWRLAECKRGCVVTPAILHPVSALLSLFTSVWDEQQCLQSDVSSFGA